MDSLRVKLTSAQTSDGPAEYLFRQPFTSLAPPEGEMRYYHLQTKDGHEAIFAFEHRSRATSTLMQDIILAGIKAPDATYLNLSAAIWGPSLKDPEILGGMLLQAMNVEFGLTGQTKATSLAAVELTMADLELCNALHAAGFETIGVHETISGNEATKSLSEFPVVMLYHRDGITREYDRPKTVHDHVVGTPLHQRGIEKKISFHVSRKDDSHPQVVSKPPSSDDRQINLVLQIEGERIKRIREIPGTSKYLAESRKQIKLTPEQRYYEIGSGLCTDLDELYGRLKSLHPDGLDPFKISFLDKDQLYRMALRAQLDAKRLPGTCYEFDIEAENRPKHHELAGSIRCVNLLCDIRFGALPNVARNLFDLLLPGGRLILAEADWSSLTCKADNVDLTPQIHPLLKLTCGQYEVKDDGILGATFADAGFKCVHNSVGATRVARGLEELHVACPESFIDNAAVFFRDKSLLQNPDSFSVEYPIRILVYEKPASGADAH